jgi:uncharacterized protein
LRDTGLLHALLGIRDIEGLSGHPIVGSSWESFAIDQVLKHVGARPQDCFFWAVHTGAELDLIIEQDGLRHGFEFKRTLAPRVTPSLHSALDALDSTGLTVVYR